MTCSDVNAYSPVMGSPLGYKTMICSPLARLSHGPSTTGLIAGPVVYTNHGYYQSFNASLALGYFAGSSGSGPFLDDGQALLPLLPVIESSSMVCTRRVPCRIHSGGQYYILALALPSQTYVSNRCWHRHTSSSVTGWLCGLLLSSSQPLGLRWRARGSAVFRSYVSACPESPYDTAGLVCCITK